MFITIVKQLKSIAHSYWYWLIYIIGGLTLLNIGLLYQYVFKEPPCVLCIQVRLWITLFVVVCFAGYLFRKIRAINTVIHISIVLIAIALIERSYQLLGTERGFLFGDCGFDLGLPAWFAIEEWLPWMYRVETSCGYTPEIFFGITIAEALMVLSVCLLLVSCSVLLAPLIKTDK